MQRLLAKQLTKDMVDQLESSEDIYSDSQDVESGIKFQSDLNSNHQFMFDTQYYTPDDKEFLWIRARNMGMTIRDYGYYESHIVPAEDIELIGEPILIAGDPFDNGLHMGNMGPKSLALMFNRQSVEDKGNDFECIRVANFYGIDMDNGTGISIFIRFSLRSLSSNNGDTLRLFEKIDDNSPSDAYQVVLESDGTLKWQIRRNDIDIVKETASGTIQTNKIYGAWFTWKNSDQTMHVYIENETNQIAPVDKTLSNASPNLWQDDKDNHDLWIFTKGAGSGGQCKGNLYDFKFYNTKVVSSTEVSNHWENKFSISAIPFGQVIMTNHWATMIEQVCSMTLTSFTTASFNACTEESFTIGSFTVNSFTF